MPRIGEITSEEEGCFKWNIDSFREEWGKTDVWFSPEFTYKNRKCHLKLRKVTESRIVIRISSYGSSLPNIHYMEFQLRTESNIVSELHSKTTHYITFDSYVLVPFKEFLSEGFHTPLHDRLIVLLRVTELNSSDVLPDEFRKCSQYPAGQAGYSYGSYAGESSYSQSGYGGTSTGAYNGSYAGDSSYSQSGYGGASTGAYTTLWKPWCSYGQQPSASSYSTRAFIKMQKDFESLLDSGENSDATFVVGGKKFPAHRTILCSRSPVFKAMLCHDTSERNSGTVNIDDCDPDSFHDFLTYVYTGSTKHINTENVISLYNTSDKYLMDELKEACVSFMKANMSVEGFCGITILALRHEEKELLESLTNFFCKNAKEIIHSENWLTFFKDSPTDANEHFMKPLLSRR